MFFGLKTPVPDLPALTPLWVSLFLAWRAKKTIGAFPGRLLKNLTTHILGLTLAQ
jgi:hypothetical protein